MTATMVTGETREDFMNKALDIAPKAVEKPPETKSDVPKESSFQQRISEVVHERNEAREKAATEAKAREALEKELATLKAPKIDPNAKPDANDFKDPYEYAEALATWSANQAIKSHQDKQDRLVEEQARQQVAKEWQTRQASFQATTPDYSEAIGSSEVSVSDEIRDALLESELGPQLLYHLAKNPEDGKKINALSPRAALKMLGRLEADLTPKTEAKTPLAAVASKAPAPITPIQAGNPGAVSPIDEKNEFHGDYNAWKQSRREGKI